MQEKDIVVRIVEYKREELSNSDALLLSKAEEMTNKAYAPYSNFYVGAAILLDNGMIVTGSNQENAAFSSGTCAERSAAFFAGANYPDAKFVTIAIAAREAGQSLLSDPISPCGGCRQALLENEKRAGRDVKVILGARDKVYILPSVKSLLPLAFINF